MLKVRALAYISGIASVSACSASSSDPAPDFGGNPSAAATSTSSGRAPSAGGSSTGAGDLSGAQRPTGLVDDAPAAQTPADSCGGVVFQPERQPLDMYFLVDTSTSMAEPTLGGGLKWNVITSSLSSFASDPSNATIDMGIGYFPRDPGVKCSAGQPDCICAPGTNLCFANPVGACSAAGYGNPAVPFTMQPAPSALVTSLGAHEPGGATPTRPALEGSYQYLESWAQTHPGRKVVAVLATDGEPTGCLQNGVSDVAQAAAAALAGSNHIQTFVIGVGLELDSLNQVASAGGTSHAYLTDAQSNLGDDFSAALNDIRASAAPCSFSLAPTGNQQQIDPSRVNIRVQPPGSTTAQVIGKTADGTAATCGSLGGWHYDDASAPHSIELCNTTCGAIQNAHVEVQFGCTTVVQSPR